MPTIQIKAQFSFDELLKMVEQLSQVGWVSGRHDL
jgi:hypothetical protein